ncbi:unnamed protein product [Phaeothamnion confervicola]
MAEHEVPHGGPLRDMVNDLQASILEAFRERNGPNAGPQGLVENAEAFCHAVDWSERWIQGLLVFHLAMLTLVLTTRRRFNFQVVLFLVICILVRMAERVNTALAARWQQFSRQNYFDEHGIFAAVMWGGPLLLLCGFQMVRSLNFLYMSANLLVEVKSEQFRRERAVKVKGAAAATGGIYGSGGGSGGVCDGAVLAATTTGDAAAKGGSAKKKD